MAPESHQKSIPTSKGVVLKKPCFFPRKNNDFEGSGGRSWGQNSIKNRSKNEVMMGRYLGIDFSWILVDLGSQVGAMLGSKIDQKSIQKAIEKQIRKRRRLGGVLEASWASKSHGTRWNRWFRGAVAETQRPLQDYPGLLGLYTLYISYIFTLGSGRLGRIMSRKGI